MHDHQYYVELMDYNAHLSAEILEAWENSVRLSSHVTACTQGPEWMQFRCGELDRGVLALLRDRKTGQVLAVTPLLRDRYTFRFRRVGKTTLRGYRLFGSSILFPNSCTIYELFLNCIFSDKNCQFIYIAVPESDNVIQFSYSIYQKSAIRKWFAFFPKTDDSFLYWIEMPGTPDVYWKKFKKKQRYNLERELKRFLGLGKIQLHRFTTPEETEIFVVQATAIAINSWQKQLGGEFIGSCFSQKAGDLLCRLSKGGLMRSYIVTLDGLPVSYCTGFQKEKLFWLYETAYDKRLERYSPGKCTLRLVIDDLFDQNTPTYISFGSSGSDYNYKRWFSTHHCKETKMLLIRNTLANRAKILTHQLTERI